MKQFLLLRGSAYYFNKRIGSRLLRLSTHTSDIRVARLRAAYLLVLSDDLSRNMMPFEQIRSQARQEAYRLHTEWVSDELSGMSRQKLAKMHKNDEIIITELSDIAGDEQESFQRRSIAWTELNFIALKRQTLKSRNPKYIAENMDLTLCSTTQSDSRLNYKLSEKLDEFLRDKQSNNSKMKSDSLHEYRVAINEFVTFTDDAHPKDVTFEKAKDFRDCLIRIPANRSKGIYKNKSFKEMMALNLPREQCLSSKTIQGRLTKLKTYFNWLEQCRIVDFNPFKSVDIKVESESYARYEIEDLNNIFNSPLFQKSKYQLGHGSKSHWWLIVLATFTGARIGELAQLRVEDITTENGIMSIQVTDDGDGMSVKTKAGIRKFPVHPFLIELGFDEYINELRLKGSLKVLPSLPTDKKKSGSAASKWYNERNRARHLNENFKKDRKVFHSFRHTFAQVAVQSDAALSKLQAIIGHEPKLFGETATYLSEPYTQAQLLEEMCKMKFEGLNLSLLRGGWQVLNKS